MAKSKFIRERSRHGWQLFWREGYDPEVCDYTDCPLGQGDMVGKPEPATTDTETWEVWAAENAVSPHVSERLDGYGFIFDDEHTAKLAQLAADAAIAKAPLPEWEAKALAAGMVWPKGKRKT